MVENPKSLTKHHDVVVKQLKKWIKTGALEWIKPKVAKKSDLLLISSMVIVPKAGPEQFRLCFDGSPVKAVESFTQACHLDSCGHALAALKQGDLLVKIDDKSGFHQLLLGKFSQELACCRYGDQLFKYRASAFGFP